MGIEENKETIKNMINLAFGTRSMCNECVHKQVCKFADDSREKCHDYKHELNYRRYADIYQMFQPIFDWMKYHYPAGGVTFYVENNKAQMHLNYGVSAYSNEIMCCCTGDGISRFAEDDKKEK